MAKEIVIIDDEDEIRSLYGLFIDQYNKKYNENYSVKEFANPLEGQDYLEKSNGLIKLAFIDWNMPERKGGQIIEELLSKGHTKTKYIVFSGYPKENLPSEMFEFQNVSYLKKNLDLNSFLEFLKSSLN